MSRSSDDGLVLVGHIGGAYGIKGWVKIISHTEPRSGILEYDPWFLKRPDDSWKPLKGITGRLHGKGIIARFDGCDDRNVALTYQGAEIAIREEQLEALDPGEYYWHQLEGLQVMGMTVEPGGEPVLLGTISHMMATGGNDVMAVIPCDGSVDERERLVPYLPEQVVKQVDLDAGRILVDWDPEF